MSAKHTSGPWQWHSFDGKSLCLVTPDRGKLIVMHCTRAGMQGATYQFVCRTGNEAGILVDATRENIGSFPDARLIAAAPDLLAACKAMRDAAQISGRVIGFNSNILDMANAAIAKADGK